MKIEGYEEISLEEYKKLPRDERRELIDGYDETICYFKKVQEFPIKHVYNDLVFILHEAGLTLKQYGAEIFIGKPDGGRFKILEQFIEKAKEVMKKNDKN